MNFALFLGGCMIVGMASAELWWRFHLRQDAAKRRLEALKAEYLDKQLWQFVSLDEWIKGSREAE